MSGKINIVFFLGWLVAYLGLNYLVYIFLHDTPFTGYSADVIDLAIGCGFGWCLGWYLNYRAIH